MVSEPGDLIGLGGEEKLVVALRYSEGCFCIRLVGGPGIWVNEHDVTAREGEGWGGGRIIFDQDETEVVVKFRNKVEPKVVISFGLKKWSGSGDPGKADEASRQERAHGEFKDFERR